jgi:hypothetical protein
MGTNVSSAQGAPPERSVMTTTPENPDTPLQDTDLETVTGSTSQPMPGGDADGTDGDSSDSDGTDGDSSDSDGTDGDSSESDGTDGTDG